MARIRHIKPDFFKHEVLNDLECQHPELRIMLTFAGLWCIADGNGLFRYSPRSIHTDILPFVNYDVQAALEILAGKKFITVEPEDAEGVRWARVNNFKKHQYVSPRERKQLPSIPEHFQAEATGQTSIPSIPAPPAGVVDAVTGEIFIDEACMVNGFDKDQFLAFAKNWAANKKVTGDDKYPTHKLRRFLIDDYKKEIKSQIGHGKRVKERGEAYVGM